MKSPSQLSSSHVFTSLPRSCRMLYGAIWSWRTRQWHYSSPCSLSRHRKDKHQAEARGATTLIIIVNVNVACDLTTGRELPLFVSHRHSRFVGNSGLWPWGRIIALPSCRIAHRFKAKPESSWTLKYDVWLSSFSWPTSIC